MSTKREKSTGLKKSPPVAADSQPAKISSKTAPKKIIDKVREKKARMEADKEEAENNSRAAVLAMMNGIKSPQWSDYMRQFVEDTTTPLGKAQLARLLATDGTSESDKFNRKRAYMLANAICGGASTGGAGGNPPTMACALADIVGGPAAEALSERTLPFDFGVNTIDDTLPNVCPGGQAGGEGSSGQ